MVRLKTKTWSARSCHACRPGGACCAASLVADAAAALLCAASLGADATAALLWRRALPGRTFNDLGDAMTKMLDRTAVVYVLGFQPECLAPDGSAPDGSSDGISMSADGRYVAFTSFATNLVAGDVNGFADVFVHDRDADGNGVFDELSGTSTRIVSVGA